jgi:hypothetical protein
MSLLRQTAFSTFFLSLLLAVTIGAVLAQADEVVKPTCTDSSATCLQEQEFYRLGLLTSKCKETKKVVGTMTYSVCHRKGKLVSAAQSLNNGCDGLRYWFENGKVVAVLYSLEETLVTFENGKAVAIYEDGGSEVDGGIKLRTKFTTAERQNFESTAATGTRYILKKLGL